MLTLISQANLQWCTVTWLCITEMTHSQPLTSSSFDNDERHMMTYWPTSEASHSWSCDKLFWQFLSWMKSSLSYCTSTNTVLIVLIHTHSRLTALFPGLPGRAATRKVKPIWILLKQETVSGNGISWAICWSALCSRETTTPAPTTLFLQAGCPSCRPTNSVKALKAQFMIITYFKIFAVGMSVDWIECLLCAKTTGHVAARHHSPSFRSVT